MGGGRLDEQSPVVTSGEQAVTFAQQQVSDIDGHRNAVNGVDGRLAVAQAVRVLDVIVDQGGLVEAFDGDGGALRVSGIVRLPRQGGIDGQQQIGTPALPTFGNPVQGGAGRHIVREGEAPAQGLRSEKGFDRRFYFIVIQRIISPFRTEIQQGFYVIRIHFGILATVVIQRNGQARDGMTHQQREGLFQGGQATDADDGIGRALTDQADHGGEAFCYEAQGAHLVRLILQGRDGTVPAAGAQQAEGIDLCLAHGLATEALGQQQDPAVGRDGGHLVAPGAVVVFDHQPAAVCSVQSFPFEKAVRQGAKVLHRERRAQVAPGSVVTDDLPEAAALLPGGRGQMDRLANHRLQNRRNISFSKTYIRHSARE